LSAGARSAAFDLFVSRYVKPFGKRFAQAAFTGGKGPGNVCDGRSYRATIGLGLDNLFAPTIEEFVSAGGYIEADCHDGNVTTQYCAYTGWEPVVPSYVNCLFAVNPGDNMFVWILAYSSQTLFIYI
jgi:hypothetical protein